MTESQSSPASTKGKILLVDDDKFLLDMYCMKFTQGGFTVHGALSVKSAFEALHGGFAPDAVLFDLIMPEETGFSLLEKLRAENLVPDAVKIALTNQDDPEEKKRAESLGADGYIVKATMIPSEVVTRVQEEIARHRKA
jgi:DNA-binding response OmpR family regulator